MFGTKIGSGIGNVRVGILHTASKVLGRAQGVDIQKSVPFCQV
jgi:hypothetical protein